MTSTARLRTAIAVIALSVSSTTVTVAQQRTAADTNWVRESWTVRDGLPVNSINQLLQTRDGYIWAATFDGLVRFDGVRFTVFNTGNTPGLPSNRIVDVLEARDGTLWLLTERFDLVRFTKNRATAIRRADGSAPGAIRVTQDTAGTIWVGTDHGVGVVRGDRLEPVAETVITGRIANVRGDRHGNVFVVNFGGRVWRIEANRQVRALPLSGDVSTTMITYDVAPVYRDSSGAVNVATLGAVWRGRDTLVKQPQIPDEIMLDIQRSSATGALWFYGVGAVLRQTASGVERVAIQSRAFPHPAMFDDPAGMWYAVANRVYLEGRLVHVLDSSGPTLDPVEITAMLVDREGSVWLGTQSAGLHRITRSLFRAYGVPEGSASNNIYPIVETPDGVVWLGTWGKGITRVDPATNSVRSYGPERGVPAFVQSILDDGDGRLVLAAGLNVHDCVTIPEIRCTTSETSPLRQAQVTALFRDADGRAWAGSQIGLFRREQGTWRLVPGAPSAPVRAATRTPDGALWMATNGGGVVRYQDGRFIPVTMAEGLPTDVIRSLYVDVDGWLWVGTEGRGLVRLDPREWTTPRKPNDRRQIVRIGTEVGLYDEVVHQILDDGAGQLWMSSNRGIFRVARAELLAFAEGRAARVSSVAYTERDGLRNREANGGYFPAGTRARDGRLWFPTQAGAVVVDPRRVERNTVAPPIVVERVLTRDRRIFADSAITLAADERDLEIQYTAPSFLEPNSLRFRYRLVPYDADWVDAATRRTAFYTRVPPGSYTFEVQVGDGRGGWHARQATLQLSIASRWYETLAARALAVALVIMGVIAAVRRRSRRLREQAAELGRLVEDRTAELRLNQQELAARNTQLAEQATALSELSGARSRMFANLSHEFRTPLTLILGPLQSLLDGRHGALSQDITAQATLMRRNAQRLLRLINQILDLARLQGGAVTLDRRVHDLVPFTESLVEVFADLAARRGITLRVVASQPSLALLFDPGQLEKVLLNLLSNALKFTPEGGRVEVSVSRDERDAVVVVQDTGVGIAAAELPHVFERFYQADGTSTRRYEGTGIGLALARELVELHGGTISATSAVNAGSAFMVRLPLSEVGIAAVGAPVSATPRRVGLDGASVLPWSGETVALPVPENALVTPAELVEDRTTVLLVDDNADVRTYVRAILTKSYRVIEAEDGEQGLELARRELPDLIVADVMMPGLDGLALGRALRADALTDAIPVVLLTARVESESQVAGYEAGADAYLTKPFEPTVLEACVSGLLTQRRRLRERYRSGELAMPITLTGSVMDAAPASADGGDPVLDAAPDVALVDALEPAAPAPDAEAGRQSAIAQRLRPIVLERLVDASLTPASLAESAGMTYHQMYRALHTDAGTTPSKFIRSVRSERAAELLQAGAGTVTEIAYAVGFESLSYFSRAFRERFGVSPVSFVAGREGDLAPDVQNTDT